MQRLGLGAVLLVFAQAMAGDEPAVLPPADAKVLAEFKVFAETEVAAAKLAYGLYIDKFIKEPVSDYRWMKKSLFRGSKLVRGRFR